MSITKWMSWEGGVDLVAIAGQGFSMPNVIVHVAKMVHTPVGSAPAGMVLWQPEANAMPACMGFISPDAKVGAYFGPHIFAGTPFEKAPALAATIDVKVLGNSASAKVVVGGFTFEVALSDVGASEMIHRAPAAMPPFWQQGMEAVAKKATLSVNGKNVPIVVPPVGISGGPAAVVTACGIYAR
jgi:hypothetical protein